MTSTSGALIRSLAKSVSPPRNFSTQEIKNAPSKFQSSQYSKTSAQFRTIRNQDYNNEEFKISQKCPHCPKKDSQRKIIKNLTAQADQFNTNRRDQSFIKTTALIQLLGNDSYVKKNIPHKIGSMPAEDNYFAIKPETKEQRKYKPPKKKTMSETQNSIIKEIKSTRSIYAEKKLTKQAHQPTGSKSNCETTPYVINIYLEPDNKNEQLEKIQSKSKDEGMKYEANQPENKATVNAEPKLTEVEKEEEENKDVVVTAKLKELKPSTDLNIENGSINKDVEKEDDETKDAVLMAKSEDQQPSTDLKTEKGSISKEKEEEDDETKDVVLMAASKDKSTSTDLNIEKEYISQKSSHESELQDQQSSEACKDLINEKKRINQTALQESGYIEEKPPDQKDVKGTLINIYKIQQGNSKQKIMAEETVAEDVSEKFQDVPQYQNQNRQKIEKEKPTKHVSQYKKPVVNLYPKTTPLTERTSGGSPPEYNLEQRIQEMIAKVSTVNMSGFSKYLKFWRELWEEKQDAKLDRTESKKAIQMIKPEKVFHPESVVENVNPYDPKMAEKEKTDEKAKTKGLTQNKELEVESRSKTGKEEYQQRSYYSTIPKSHSKYDTKRVDDFVAKFHQAISVENGAANTSNMREAKVTCKQMGKKLKIKKNWTEVEKSENDEQLRDDQEGDEIEHKNIKDKRKREHQKRN